MNSRSRWVSLPVAAVVAVALVLGVEVANGGGRYQPLKPADPCVARVVTTQAEGIDGLTERLVLLGIDGAACRLRVTREALTLELAQSDTQTDAQIDALREGLLEAVTRLQDSGTLPPASDLVDDALESADLNRFVARAIRLLPDAVVNSALKTDDVLIRTINDLDLRELLSHLDEPRDLEDQVSAAVTQAVRDSLTDRLRNLV